MGRYALTAAQTELVVFGMASLGEVEAILLTASLAAILAVWGVITQRVVTRRSATLDFLSRVDTDNDLIDAREKFNKLTEVDGGLAVYADPKKYHTDDAKSIRLVLNEHERIALGIQFGILDREFVKRHCRGQLIADWTFAAPFVYKIRAETSNPAIYHEFEDLVSLMQQNKMPRRGYFWRLWF